MAPLPLVAQSADRERPYTIVDDRLWFVDTGASRTTCDDGLVAALGLTARPTLRRSWGEVGSVPLRRVVLRDVTIGGWTFRRLPCAVRDLASTSSIPVDPADPVAGVLGANLFRHFVVDLDAGERALRLHAADAVQDLGGDVAEMLREGVALRRERGVGPRLVAALEVDGVALDVIIDTGADRTYLPLTTGAVEARYTAERQGTGPGGARLTEVVIRGVVTATIGGRALPLRRYLYRRARPGLLGMDALQFTRVVVDAPGRRLAWVPGAPPPLLVGDEARRALLEADPSADGRRRLAAWELAHGDPARALDLYAALGDVPARLGALLRLGAWEEARVLGGEPTVAGRFEARLVGAVEAGGDPDLFDGDAIVARRWADLDSVRDQLWAVRQGATAADVGRGPWGALLQALAAEAGAPGTATLPCATVPEPHDLDGVRLVVACGQAARALAALPALEPRGGRQSPAGAAARADWLDVFAVLREAMGAPAEAASALDQALRLAPYDAYLHVRRVEMRRRTGL
jgi:hypothetical protein